MSVFHTPHPNGILFRHRQRLSRAAAPVQRTTRKAKEAKPPKAPSKTTLQMDELAEIMAEGCGSIREAAEIMGLGKSRVGRLWQRIRAGLGEQAV